MIEFEGENLVLGVVWLANLGPTVTDYATRIRQFYAQNKRITWVGIPGPSVEYVLTLILAAFTLQ